MTKEQQLKKLEQVKNDIAALRKRLAEEDLRWSTQDMILDRIKYKKELLNELYKENN